MPINVVGLFNKTKTILIIDSLEREVMQEQDESENAVVMLKKYIDNKKGEMTPSVLR